MARLKRWSAKYLRFGLVVLGTLLAIVGLTLTSGAGFSLKGTPALAQVAPTHPLDSLTAAEFTLTKEFLTAAGYVDESSRFPLITLHEPPKAEVLSWEPGQPFSRAAFAIVKQGPDTYEAVVNLAAGSVTSWEKQEDVQPNLLLEELIGVTDLVTADPRWQDAMAKRGITEYSQINCAPLTAGYYGLPEHEGRRILNVPCSDLSNTQNNIYGSPIEGVMAVVDLNQQQVLEVIDNGVVPISTKSHAFSEEGAKDVFGELRSPLNPIALVQPEGNNITLNHNVIDWQKWSFHLGFDRRLGTVISMVNYQDNGQIRPVLYEGALSEIFVPYMDSGDAWYYRTYMDSGEYGFGWLATPLVAGIDCPTNATFIDAVLPDDEGNAFTTEDAICVFEQYQGNPIWRHNEVTNETYEGRPQVDLVVRMMSTIGNYDYALDWIFSQSGMIKVMVGATGVDAVKGVTAQSMSDPTALADTTYGTLIAPGLVGVSHDHFFSFRLDLDVDGTANRLVKDGLRLQELPADHPRRSIWMPESQVLATDTQARLKLNYDTPSRWRIESSEATNYLGNPTSYQIMPIDNSANLLLPEDYPTQRAGFVKYHLWVTPYDPNEIYAAGTYPNQSKGDDTLFTWTGNDRPIVDTDIVTWYTLGFHHVTVAEDWPIMSTSWHGFALKPVNFFDRNPSLDLRRPA
ncbi:primary-amine oxidase [Egbenema bharatensis]|uniref:primary-amine oxidase n=1 Tax=Egbenema bharatensis TaxID=3463334 RepID=UPI003A8A755F